MSAVKKICKVFEPGSLGNNKGEEQEGSNVGKANKS